MPADLPDLDGRRVLVTGGAGFIGSHLVDALLERGARVRVLDDFSTGRHENLAHLPPDAIDLRESDLRDPAACRAACAGVALVFHQAALGSIPRSMEHPAVSLGVNVQGTAELLTAARDANVERVIYASSSSVYGDSETLPRRVGEEGRAVSPYAASKRICEELAEVFAACYGMQLVGLRYFNVYGPRQDPSGPYAAVIPRFFRAALAGEAPVIYGDGAQTRDFTFVADAVRANLLAAAAPVEACGGTYNVAAGRATSILELAEAIRRRAGSTASPRHEPTRPGDVRHSLADLSLTREKLGYEPSVALDDGLAACHAEYERIAAAARG